MFSALFEIMGKARKKTLAKQQARQFYKSEKYTDRQIKREVNRYNKLAVRNGSQTITPELMRGLTNYNKQSFVSFLQSQTEDTFKRRLPRSPKGNAPLESEYNLDYYVSSVVSNIRADDYHRRSNLTSKSLGQPLDDYNKRNIYKATTEEALRNNRVGYRSMTKKKKEQFYKSANYYLNDSHLDISSYNHVENLKKAINDKYLSADAKQLISQLDEAVKTYGYNAVSDSFLSEIQSPFDIVYLQELTGYQNSINELETIISNIGVENE